MKKRRKWKSVVAILLVLSLLGGGGYVGVRRYLSNNEKTVDVYAVSNLNAASWLSYYSETSSSGTVVSDVTQNVYVPEDKVIHEVFVSEGDEVKIGDKLLSYDTTLLELDRESQDLKLQELELELESAQADLKKLQNTVPVAYKPAEDQELYGPGDLDIEGGDYEGGDVEASMRLSAGRAMHTTQDGAADSETTDLTPDEASDKKSDGKSDETTDEKTDGKPKKSEQKGDKKAEQASEVESESDVTGETEEEQILTEIQDPSKDPMDHVDFDDLEKFFTEENGPDGEGLPGEGQDAPANQKKSRSLLRLLTHIRLKQAVSGEEETLLADTREEAETGEAVTARLTDGAIHLIPHFAENADAHFQKQDTYAMRIKGLTLREEKAGKLFGIAVVNGEDYPEIGAYTLMQDPENSNVAHLTLAFHDGLDEQHAIAAELEDAYVEIPLALDEITGEELVFRTKKKENDIKLRVEKPEGQDTTEVPTDDTQPDTTETPADGATDAPADGAQPSTSGTPVDGETDTPAGGAQPSTTETPVDGATNTPAGGAQPDPAQDSTEDTDAAENEGDLKPPTEGDIDAPTETPTDSATEAPTEAPTEPATEAPTEVSTEPVTEASTETPTEPVTEVQIEAPAETPTEPATEVSTEAPTEAQTEAASATRILFEVFWYHGSNVESLWPTSLKVQFYDKEDVDQETCLWKTTIPKKDEAGEPVEALTEAQTEDPAGDQEPETETEDPWAMEDLGDLGLDGLGGFGGLDGAGKDGMDSMGGLGEDAYDLGDAGYLEIGADASLGTPVGNTDAELDVSGASAAEDAFGVGVTGMDTASVDSQETVTDEETSLADTETSLTEGESETEVLEGVLQQVLPSEENTYSATHVLAYRDWKPLLGDPASYQMVVKGKGTLPYIPLISWEKTADPSVVKCTISMKYLEPQESPLMKLEPLSELTYETGARGQYYKGEGTKDDPYVFFVADGVVIQSSFVNWVLGFNADGTARERMGSYVVLEIRESDTITGAFIRSVGLDGTIRMDTGYGPGTYWIFASDSGIMRYEEEVDEPFEDDDLDPGWTDFGDSYTAQELADAIAAKEREIRRLNLDKKEGEMKLRQLDRDLENSTVVSSVEGYVKSLGGEAGQPYLVVTSEGGMYLRTSVGELDRDSIHVGDTVEATSWEAGKFTATITEIADYPNNAEQSYGWAQNPNSSNYPVIARIENTEGLSPYMYAEVRFRRSESGDVSSVGTDEEGQADGMYIQVSYVRSENGQSYVYIADGNGLLKKQYVKTGATMEGHVEIKEGLSNEDYIAFPYGKAVVEGAKTKVSEQVYY